MIKATVNQREIIEIAGHLVNGEEREIDIVKINEVEFHLLLDGRSFRAQLVSRTPEEKKMTVLINGNEYEVALQDKTDQLLKKLGLNNSSAAKNNLFKAPMPGLIKQVLVAEGQAVTKGEVLLVLEAMKMENALKSAADGIVKKINVIEGQAVEKGMLLLSME